MSPETMPAQETPLAAETVAEALHRIVQLRPEGRALRTLDGRVDLTWAQLGRRVESVAAGLASLGVRRGDTVAIILPNTPECHIVDHAAMLLGGIPYAVFNSSPANQIVHQLRNARTGVVVTQATFLPKVQDAVAQLGQQVRHLILTDGESVDGTMSFGDVESAGHPDFDAEACRRSLSADDLATLIYTSGTTGPPKAALWSHRGVMSELRALEAALPLPREAVISFLPMAHAGGRICTQYMSLVHGACVTACPDIADLPRHVATVHPDAFMSTPRFWEKLQVAVESMIDADPDPVSREAGQQAIRTGLLRVRAEEPDSGVAADELARLQAEHDDALHTLHPVLHRAGIDRLSAPWVGGAPPPPDVVRFFRAVGVPLLEAYGSTETSLNVFNRVDDYRIGTAGKPLPGVEIRLGDDDELLVRSDLNFVGYLNQPEETAAALDADGWVHTGDIVDIDDDGFVSIVDRKKEIIINSAGKNMSPALIEGSIKGECSLIGQMVAIGDARRYVTALITLDPEALPMYARRLGLTGQGLAELVMSEGIRSEIQAAVDRGNARLNSNEQVKKFTLIGSTWLPDSDELTPTGKLKRRILHKKYADEIESLYAN